MACPASQVAPEVRIENRTPEASIGTAVHRFMAAHVVGLEDREHVVAAELGLDEEAREQAGIIYATAKKLWRQFHMWFPDPRTEVYLEHGQLTGHIDVFSSVPGEVRVLDYKTGRLDLDHHEQLRGYSWLALQDMPEADSAYGMVVNVRAGTYDAERFTREELDAWHAGLIERIGNTNVYIAGRHCGYCPRRHECPARMQLLKQALVTLDIADRGMSERELGQLFLAAKAMEQVIEDAIALVRAEVISRGGTMRISGGQQIEIVHQERKDIMFQQGWPALMQQPELVNQTLLDSMKVPKTALDKAARAVASKGHGAAYIRMIMQKLQDAGAIRKKVVPIMQVRKVRD
jgi:hypothetical protein